MPSQRVQYGLEKRLAPQKCGCFPDSTVLMPRAHHAKWDLSLKSQHHLVTSSTGVKSNQSERLTPHPNGMVHAGPAASPAAALRAHCSQVHCTLEGFWIALLKSARMKGLVPLMVKPSRRLLSSVSFLSGRELRPQRPWRCAKHIWLLWREGFRQHLQQQLRAAGEAGLNSCFAVMTHRGSDAYASLAVMTPYCCSLCSCTL